MHTMTKSTRLIGMVLLIMFVVPFVAYGAGDELDHILVSSDNVLYEYTSDGAFVQEMAIPEAPGYSAMSRDLIKSNYGSVAVYNGTFEPVLSLYEDETGQWSEMTADGWSTVNNVSYGGIACDSNAVFVTDMATAGEGAPKGIIRFDMDNEGWERFFSGQDYIDVAMGLDSRLYALRNVYGDLDVIDPQGMQLLYSLDLGHTSAVRGVAVKADGTIFAASWNGNIYQYDDAAQLVETYATGMGSLCDIDNNETGTIIVGARSGDVAVTDAEFSFFTVINLEGNGPAFVAYVPSAPELSEISPWKDNCTGNLVTDINWNYAMGYNFTPLVDGVVTKLGGFFNGTRTVRLFDYFTGELLSEVIVTANNDWAYEEIDPVSVQEGNTYTVAVYLNGSGGSYRWGIDRFPQEYQHIRIEGTTYAYTGFDPDARPTYTFPYYMFGQADIGFVPAE